jgi:hypothetical protein
MRILAWVVLCATTVLVVAPALADEKAACLDAASKAQNLRDNHKLVEAREQLRRCAAATCPAVVQGDCANWLTEVEKALPTVVVTAKSPTGADLVAVTVSVDGQALVSKLDGQAVPLNAGLHTFHFEGSAGASIDQQVLVKEGEKNQPIAVVLGAPAAPAVPTTPAAPAPSPVDSGGGSSPWRTVGWVAGGLGAAGLAMGGVFGLLAINAKSNAHCDANNVCDANTASGVKSAALLSDVGWMAGGVLLAGGAALVLLAPRTGHEQAASAQVAPVVMANGAGAAVAGRW